MGSGGSLAARRNRRLGVVVYAAMALFIVGSAAPVPLLPLYGEQLDLPPDRVALIFGTYFATMVLSLLVGSTPRAQVRPRLTLGIALVLSLAADVAFLIGTEPALLVARILTGLSVGTGIGAGASLALSTRGERGRSVAATMTMTAGIIGVLGAALLADLTPWPTRAPFALHGVAVILTLVALMLSPGPESRARTAEPQHAASSPEEALVPSGQPAKSMTGGPPLSKPGRSAVITCAGIGVLAWSLGNLVVGLVPSLVRSTTSTGSIVEASMAALLVASCGAVAQYALPLTRLRLAAGLSALLLVSGATCALAGIAADQVSLLLAGAALVGAGQGAGYRLGMAASTRGLAPGRHGARTSLYASAAYFSAALTVQFGGLLMTAMGVGGLQVVLTGLLVIALGLTASWILTRWRPAGPASAVAPQP